MAGEPRVWEVAFLLLSVGTPVRATRCEGKSEVKVVRWAARVSVEWGSSVSQGGSRRRHKPNVPRVFLLFSSFDAASRQRTCLSW